MTAPPGHELVVRREPLDSEMHASLGTVAIDAFKAMRRQLEELRERQRARSDASLAEPLMGRGSSGSSPATSLGRRRWSRSRTPRPDLFWTGELRTLLATDVRWDATPFVLPLVQALAMHERYAVTLLDKERARVLVVHVGEVEDEREALAPGDVHRKKASGTDRWRSHMQFQRQDETHVAWHVRDVAAVLGDVARGGPFARLVVAGPVEATSELVRSLPRELGERVVGTLRLPVEASRDEILRATRDAVEAAVRQREESDVVAVLDGGAVGLDATLGALEEGRLRALVSADRFASAGHECPRCHALFAAVRDGACARCQARLLALPDLVDRTVARVAAPRGGRHRRRPQVLSDEATHARPRRRRPPHVVEDARRRAGTDRSRRRRRRRGPRREYDRRRGREGRAPSGSSPASPRAASSATPRRTGPSPSSRATSSSSTGTRSRWPGSRGSAPSAASGAGVRRRTTASGASPGAGSRAAGAGGAAGAAGAPSSTRRRGRAGSPRRGAGRSANGARRRGARASPRRSRRRARGARSGSAPP